MSEKGKYLVGYGWICREAIGAGQNVVGLARPISWKPEDGVTHVLVVQDDAAICPELAADIVDIMHGHGVYVGPGFRPYRFLCPIETTVQQVLLAHSLRFIGLNEVNRDGMPLADGEQPIAPKVIGDEQPVAEPSAEPTETTEQTTEQTTEPVAESKTTKKKK